MFEIDKKEIQEMAKAWGYSNMFATPKDADDLTAVIEKYAGALKATDRVALYTCIGMTANFYAIELAKHEKKVVGLGVTLKG